MTNLFEYCESNDLEIKFVLQGFLIFALHCMRNTQVRKNIKLIINSISSSSYVKINIRGVLRTIFHVAPLPIDQRGIQKKDEHRFFIFHKENYRMKSSQVSPSKVGDVWAAELQACAEFESKLHVT